jgi:hypothetical protein
MTITQNPDQAHDDQAFVSLHAARDFDPWTAPGIALYGLFFGFQCGPWNYL